MQHMSEGEQQALGWAIERFRLISSEALLSAGGYSAIDWERTAAEFLTQAPAEELAALSAFGLDQLTGALFAVLQRLKGGAGLVQ
jgi:hypothetical protein